MRAHMGTCVHMRMCEWACSGVGTGGLRINMESVEKAQDWVPRDRVSRPGFVAG